MQIFVLIIRDKLFKVKRFYKKEENRKNTQRRGNLLPRQQSVAPLWQDCGFIKEASTAPLARASENTEPPSIRGFAPLAARSAPTLSTSSFAVGLTVIQLPQGKAFCSRKTAPSRAKLFFALGHAHAYLSAFTYLAPTRHYQRLA